MNFGHLPDMVYSKNVLRLTHNKTQFRITFNAYDAVKGNNILIWKYEYLVLLIIRIAYC